MPTIQLEKIALNYTTQGTGNAPVILIHGNFSSSEFWNAFLSRNLDGFTVYAVDLRGCGASASPEGDYDIETMSNDILQFADKLNLKRFHLVGHSLGGAIAQQLAGTEPHRIITLSLVAPAPAEGFSMGLINTIISRLFPPPKTLARLEKYGLKKASLAKGLKKSMPGVKNNADLLNKLADIACQMDPKAIAGFWDTLNKWKGEQLLKNFNFPVLIMHGDLDPIIKRRPLIKMEKTIANCTLIKYSRIGHAPQLEAPAKFHEHLTTFLQGKTPHQQARISILDKIKAFIFRRT
jgi:branched-chain amino acid transport system permease protein